LLELAGRHPCSAHSLFAELASARLDAEAAARVLRNYDAHASVLRRLLLLAAGIMPEPAVGFVLENVRNEYGNGNYCDNHQSQLKDVAVSAGVSESMWRAVSITDGVKKFIKQAPQFYYPVEDRGHPARIRSGLGSSACSRSEPQCAPSGEARAPRVAAMAAGAITATEILAISEFKALQKAFAPLGLANHRWFNHVTIEEEHSDESLMLALYFIEEHDGFADVEAGMKGILDANCHLYDGLLAALRGA
jgi:hypothetical protein